MSLAESILRKENHLRICRQAGRDWRLSVAKVRRRHRGVAIQVEVQTQRDFREVLSIKPPRVLLDNFAQPLCAA